MRIGYNTWGAATVPYSQFIPALAEIGFGAIAISVVPSYSIGGRVVDNAAALDRLQSDDRRRIRQAFQERDLKLPSVIGNQSLVEDDPEIAERALSRLRASIDLCLDLVFEGEVPTLNTGTGGQKGDLEVPARRQMILDRLGSLVEYAARRGVVVCIEPHVNAPVDSVERAEWLVRTINSPWLQLDFDISHFEVVGVPMDAVVPRLAPLARAAEIKDQHFRYIDSESAAASDWGVQGNGRGQALAPDGREVEFQFLLAGEGTFDLPRYLRLMRAQGHAGPIAFEASVQCQARPDYDALVSAADTYRWMSAGWKRAGIPIDSPAKTGGRR
jgi:sugar phosphate isomerase/epimerase